jgi:putative ABC transport system permease protein
MLRLYSIAVVALRALRRNLLRSVLTALGIIIGVSCVITMVSIGNGAKSQVEKQISQLGQNIVTVFPGSANTGGMRGGWGSMSTLTVEEAEAIEREVPGVAAVSPGFRDRSQIIGNGLNWNTSIQGESPAFIEIRQWPLATGAMFSEQEVKTAAKVCIIGETVRKQLYPETDPIGQSIRIKGQPFKILGVLTTKGVNFFGQDQDDVVVVPYSSGLRRLARRPNLNQITIQAASPDIMDAVKADVTELLRQRRPGRDDDFNVRTLDELVQAATATSRTMTQLLSAIAGVSLIVGGIGIMNIMLVSVTERTREIGVRLAVGARGHDIRLQFLTEAVVLSLLGGALGVALGLGASEFLSARNNWPTLVSGDSVAIALACSAAVGVVFGFYPAHKAAQLDPIEALRYE